jgi:hypothetical protein
MRGFRGWASLLLGIVLVVIGGIPLLNKYGVIGFAIPQLSLYVLRILFVAAGVFMLWDAAHETVAGARFFMWASILFGIPIILLGVIPLLNQYGVIAFNPGFLNMSDFIANLFAAIAGLILIVDAFKATRL